MERQPDGRPAERGTTHLFLALAGGLAAALTLLATSRHGIGLSPDSAYYLSAAENLARGHGLVCFDGSPLVAWPPLYSALLALPSLAGVGLAAARVLNAVAFGAAVHLAGLAFTRTLRSRLLGLGAALSVAVSLPLLAVSVMAWTETVFALLAVAFVLLLARYLSRPSPRALAATCILGALLPLQRYIGGSFILAGVLLVVFNRAGRPLGRRLGSAAVLVTSSLLPVVAWAVRNRAVAGTLTGKRSLDPGNLLPNLKAFYGTVAELFVPRGVVFDAAWVVALLVGSAVAVLVLLSSRRRQGPAPVLLRTTTVCATCYLASVVVVLTPEAHDQIGRLLAPVYAFLLLLALAAGEKLARVRAKTPHRRLTTWLLLAGFALWNILPVSRTVAALRDWSRDGVGVYDTGEWRRSPLVDLLRSEPPPGPIHSNDPAAVYLLARLPARMSPRAGQDLADVDIRPGDYLVWFRRVNRPYLLPLRELDRRWPLREVAFVGDGGVLVFEPPADPGH